MAANTADAERVSFEDEPLILVDEHDREVGFLDKQRCHDGAGVLHRAFSLFVFNPGGEVLLQQRSAQKRLWPLYWSNSCCSHPRRGEDMEQAARRRLREELDLEATLRYLYKFQYAASYEALGSEREFCWVYSATTDQDPRVNPNEISAWRWITPEELDREIEEHSEKFTPWSLMEWRRIRTDFSTTMSGR